MKLLIKLGGTLLDAAETRERLNEYFRPRNRRLYDLTGMDFGWPS